DTIEREPRSPARYEAERLVPETASPFRYLSDSAAGAGGLVKVGTAAPGDGVRLTVDVARPGRYLLTLGVKEFTTRGTCQVTVDGAPVGAPLDLYAARATFAALPAGEVVVDRPGNLAIGCQVTGRNPASTGDDLAVDYVTLTPAGP